MVLESLVNPRKAENKPLRVLAVSIFYTFIAIIFANFLFPSEVSLLAVALLTMIFLPFFQKLFIIEEEKEITRTKIKNILVTHIQIVNVFAAFFLGVIIATSFVYIFFTQDIFSLQTSVIRSFSGSGAFVQYGDFSRFFLNNTQVMLVTYILSILFGAGAVFILAWNASVIGVFIGITAQSFVGKGYPVAAAYAIGLPFGLSSIALHGVPEVLAYFLAAVAGGVLSVGVIREKWKSKEFHLVVKDSLKFLVLAEVLIIIAALIEAA